MNIKRSMFASFAARAARIIYLAVSAAALFIVPSAFAQQDKYEITDSPPPLKVLAADDRKRLESAKDVKARTKLALEMMEARLAAATARSEASDHSAMFDELGAFHAIMDNTLEFLDTSSPSKKKVIYNFKRLEIGLRRMAPRIDVLRRDAPVERERYLFYLARNVRDARARAIEPLFSDTVVPGRPRQQNQQ
jgi:hypothetical protein